MKRKILSYLLVALILLSLSLDLTIRPVAADDTVQEVPQSFEDEGLTDPQEIEKKDDKTSGTPAEVEGETETTSEDNDSVETPIEKPQTNPVNTPESDKENSAKKPMENLQQALKSEEANRPQLRSIIRPTEPTHTYIFKIDDEEIAQQIVKNGEKLLEPETPQKDHGRFLGWQEEGAVSEDLIDFSETIEVQETKTITLVAKFEEIYYIYFMWPTEEGDLNVIASREGQSGESIDTTDVLFSDIVSPKLEDQAFDGWYTNEKLTGDPVGDSIKITNEDITLWPKFRTTGYWLHFFPGESASTVESRFVKQNETTTEPPAPTRVGYTFQYWSKSEPGPDADPGNNKPSRYTFGNPLTADTKLYAVWAPAEVNYTVVFWKQRVTDDKQAGNDDKTYDITHVLENSRTALTGSSVGPGAEDINLTNTNPDEYKYFHYNEEKSVHVTVEPDGSTVLNIYYDRDILYVTLHFLDEYAEYTDGEVKTISGLYGSAVKKYTEEYETAYPDETLHNYPSYVPYMWDASPDPKQAVRMRVHPITFNFEGKLFENAQIDQNDGKLTAHLYEKTDFLARFYNAIYFQKVDLSYNEPLEEYQDDRVMGLWGTYYPTLDAYPGFTLYQYCTEYIPKSDEWIEFDGNPIEIPELNPPPERFFHIRAKRNSYNLIFWNYDKEVNRGSLLYEELLKGEHGQDYQNYKLTKDLRPQHLPDYYTFEGWYLSDQFEGQPCDFDTEKMPASDLVLFAKWGDGRSVEALAYLTKDGGNAKALTKEYGAIIQAADLPQVVRENGDEVLSGDENYKVTIPDHAQWIGWATKDDNNNFQLYSFGQAVYTRTELYPYYVDKDLLTVTYHYPGASDEIIKVDSKAYAKNSLVDIWSWPDDGVVPDNKVFLAWTTDKAKSDASRDPAATEVATDPQSSYTPKKSIVIEANVDLYPLFGPKEDQVNITYHGNGGKLSWPDGEEEVIIEPAVPNNSTLSVLANTKEAGLGFERQVELQSGWKNCAFRHWEYTREGKTFQAKPDDKYMLDLKDPANNVFKAVWATPIEIKVTTLWDDNNDAAKKRPNQVTFNLLINTEMLDDTLTLNETAQWLGWFGQDGNLWDIDDNGKTNDYQLLVPDVKDYNKTIEGDFKTGFTVTYSYSPKPIPTPDPIPTPEITPTPAPSGPVIRLVPPKLKHESLPKATMPAPSVPKPNQVVRLPRTGESRLVNYSLSASLVLTVALLAFLRKKYKG